VRCRWKGLVEGYKKGHTHLCPNCNRLQMGAVENFQKKIFF